MCSCTCSCTWKKPCCFFRAYKDLSLPVDLLYSDHLAFGWQPVWRDGMCRLTHYCVFLQTQPRSFLHAVACNCWKQRHMEVGLPIPVNIVCCTQRALVFPQACSKPAHAVRVFLIFQCLIRPWNSLLFVEQSSGWPRLCFQFLQGAKEDLGGSSWWKCAWSFVVVLLGWGEGLWHVERSAGGAGAGGTALCRALAEKVMPVAI